jgi:nitronate monooxygenase
VDAASGHETVLTTTFSGGWPDAPHRVLASSVAAADALDDDVAGWLESSGARRPVSRYSVSPPTRSTEGHVEAMALYAGTGVGDVTAIGPAADVVAELTSELA